MERNRGFTLIELMIVVAIIGILSAIALHQFTLYRSKALNAAAQADLRNSITAEEGYYALHYKYFTKQISASPTGGGDSTLSLVASSNVGLSLSTYGASDFTASARNSFGNHTYTVTGSVGKIR